jgi:hypothetical protein
MVVNDDAGCLIPRGALSSIASTPTTMPGLISELTYINQRSV